MNGYILSTFYLAGLMIGTLVILPIHSRLAQSNSNSTSNLMLIELNGIGWLIAVIQYNISAYTGLVLIAITMAIAITKIDLLNRKITNKSLLILFVIGLMTMAPNMSRLPIQSHLIGLLLGGVLFLIPYLSNKGMGAGDVKYMLVVGLLLGYPNILYAIAVLFVTLLIWTIWKATGRENILKTEIALAPFISIGFVTTLLVSNK